MATLLNPKARPESKGDRFVNFQFLKIDRNFRTMQSNEKIVAKQEFLDAFDRFSEQTIMLPYSVMGLRPDCDLLLWRIDPDLETFQRTSERLMNTGIGKWMRPVHSFLASTKPPTHLKDTVEPAGDMGMPGDKRFVFVHPLVKHRVWYQLSAADRRKILEEQTKIRAGFPSVRLHTAYSYGIDEQEFMLAFESDDPQDFVELGAQLRESGWGAYTLRDTPTFTCTNKPLGDILDGMG
jgi:chlorite dismutase